MALSGVLLSRSLAKGRRRHYVGKVRGILWPYAVWMTFDIIHVMVDSAVAGEPLPWHIVGQAFYNPAGYIWFLGYLFAFHAVAGVMPAPLRTLAVPAAFALNHVVVTYDLAGTDVDRVLWLLPYFLLGDLVARALAGRVPAALGVAANRLSVRPLAAVGRASIVYYVVHMLVIVYAVPLLWHGLGIHHAWLVWAIAVALSLAAGHALARVQHRPGWRWLFAWPTNRTSHGRTADLPPREINRDLAHRSGSMSLT
jgi:peptidoglycan/LPS O-acetylase OafA/YrhL